MVKRIYTLIIIMFFVSPILSNQWHEEADRYWNEARRLKKERNYKESAENIKKAIIAERKNENPRIEYLIMQINELGFLHDMMGNYEKSLHYYQLSLSTAQKYSNVEMAAEALYNIGQSHFKSNNMNEAMISYKEALNLVGKNNITDKAMVIYNSMAMVSRAKKNFPEALELYIKAYDLAKNSINKLNLAAIINNIGTMLFLKGDYEKSLDQYSQALALDRSSSNIEYLSIDLSNMGSVYAALGKLGEALNYFEKALETDIQLKQEINMASRYNRIGDIYYRLGDNSRALENYTKSLEINLKLNNRINAALVHGNIGQLYESMGKYDEAMENYIKALSYNKEMELKENISIRLSDIGMFYKTRDRYSEAIDYLGKALLQDVVTEKKNRIAENLSNIGQVLILQKQYNKALGYFNQSLELFREMDNVTSIAEELKNCGIVYFYLKDFNKAGECFENAVKIIESVEREKISPLEDNNVDLYRWFIATYVRANKPERAFEISEELSIKKIQTYVGRSISKENKKENSYIRVKNQLRLNSIVVIFSNMEWDQPDLVVFDRDSASCHELEKEGLVNSIYAIAGKEIEKYSGDEKVDIDFKIRQKSRRDIYYVEFERIVNYYRHLLSKKYINSEEYEILKKVSSVLYSFLFKNIEKNIAGKEELIIQPGGILSTIPFETLIMSDGSFMAEKYNIVYQNSSFVYNKEKSGTYKPGKKWIFSVGNITKTSRLKKLKIESVRHFDIINKAIYQRINDDKSIKEFYGFFGIEDLNEDLFSMLETEAFNTMNKNCTSIIGKDANEIEIKKLSRTGILRDYRILHFSTGGIIIPEAPLLSSIVLSSGRDDGGGEDGFLNYRELSGLSLESDLVHISGLQIPRSRYTRGEGVWSICCALFASGSKNVSFSLWPVEDKSKMYFMKHVYQLVLEKGVSVDKAFTETKRIFIRGKVEMKTGADVNINSSANESGKVFTNPYFWGSFVVYGH